MKGISEPLVDVIIAAHNAARWIDETIWSVRTQTASSWRLIVVDDGSLDGTDEIVRRHELEDARIELLARPNRGAAVARNTGFERGHAPYVVFLDADDAWEPDALEHLILGLRAAPDAPAAHGFGHTIDEDGRLLEGWNGSPEIGRQRPAIVSGTRAVLPSDEPTDLRAFVVSCPIPTPGMVLVRRAALELEPGPIWDQQAFPADDWLLWARLARRHGGFAFVDRPVLRYRRSATQATANSPHLGGADAYVRRSLLAQAQHEGDRELVEAGWRYEWLRTAAIRRQWMLESIAAGHPVAAARQARHWVVAWWRASPRSGWTPAGSVPAAALTEASTS